MATCIKESLRRIKCRVLGNLLGMMDDVIRGFGEII
jgi:hypothetical protein